MNLPPEALKVLEAFGGLASRNLDLSHVSVLNTHEQVGADAQDGQATVTSLAAGGFELNDSTLAAAHPLAVGRRAV